ncbi:MAG TPA: hypothetical protein PKG91_05470, partial [Bacilli bacterium]|nr:hypothetical protein [Bacilli bacterium]
MIDVHTHILPFVDDGSESLEESFRMIEREISLGMPAGRITIITA